MSEVLSQVYSKETIDELAPWWVIARAEGREEGRAEGREEGRAEGRAEGREEGRVGTAVKNVKRLLSRRFGQLSPEITQALDKKVVAVSDEAECNRMIDLALDCATLEEFRASL